MKKYLVIGGSVFSQTDGQEHYVDARQLCQLYHVDPSECLLVEGRDPQSPLGIHQEDYTVLHPRSDGNYTLPTCDFPEPHLKHSWWVDTPELSHSQAYRLCEGVKDPARPGYERTKQAQGIFHAKDELTIEGDYHLHFIFNSRGRWEWLVRYSKSPLCGTPRCRLVTITPQRPSGFAVIGVTE